MQKRLLKQYFKWTERNLLEQPASRVQDESEVRDSIYEKIKERIDTTPAQREIPYRWMHLAAAASILVVIGLIIWFPSTPPALSWQKLENRSQTVRFAYLPDSSKVWLNAGTTLKYPAHFRGPFRNVALEGEAYFEVVRDEEKPFLVQSQGVTTRVLGTRFNVKAYPQMERVAVTVVSGKVGVLGEGKENKSILLTANQQAVYHKLSKALSQQADMDAQNEIAWQSGRLVFHNTPLPEVLLAIYHKYGQKIESSAAFDRCSIYFEFSDETFKETLNLLEKLTGSSIKNINGTYEMTGNGCQ